MTLPSAPAAEKQDVNQVVHEPQHHELIHAYQAAKTLEERLEIVGLEAEAAAARSQRHRIHAHMSGTAYVDHFGRLVRP